jgi:hypothetical protein
MPTPYSPAGGKADALRAISSRKNCVGDLDQDAGAVAHQRIRTHGTAVIQVAEDLQALLDDPVRLRLPLMCATKPTPQASCSFAPEYRPWSTGSAVGAGDGRGEGRDFDDGAVAALGSVHLRARSTWESGQDQCRRIRIGASGRGIIQGTAGQPSGPRGPMFRPDVPTRGSNRCCRTDVPELMHRNAKKSAELAGIPSSDWY